VKGSLPEPPLLIITDPPAPPRTIENVVAEALEAGCRWFMYRDKNQSTKEFAATAAVLSKLCNQYEAILCINGNTEIADSYLGCGAHVQSGKEVYRVRRRIKRSGLIGVSCHSIAEGLKAEKAGADYITLSPIFETASKPGYGPLLGAVVLKEAAKQIGIPIIALAGITSSNAAECIRNGASGVAVMGGVMKATEPGLEVAALIKEIMV
jgi:thiamine-phosphate pyrophosphorylase